MKNNSLLFDGRSCVEIKMEQLIFAFSFKKAYIQEKKMEESQKSKKMKEKCSFQQEANNHRTRRLKFYKTDVGSLQLT